MTSWASSSSYHSRSPWRSRRRERRRTRRDKRRATHKVEAPRLNECPRCHSPRLPHRVCPVCGTYAGREVIAHEIGEADSRRAGEPRSSR